MIPPIFGEVGGGSLNGDSNGAWKSISVDFVFKLQKKRKKKIKAFVILATKEIPNLKVLLLS